MLIVVRLIHENGDVNINLFPISILVGAKQNITYLYVKGFDRGGLLFWSATTLPGCAICALVLSPCKEIYSAIVSSLIWGVKVLNIAFGPYWENGCVVHDNDCVCVHASKHLCIYSIMMFVYVYFPAFYRQKQWTLLVNFLVQIVQWTLL